MRHFKRLLCLTGTPSLLSVTLAVLCLLGASIPAWAANPQADAVLRNYPQAANMAGYVLNNELNMNQINSRKLNHGLLPSSSQWDQSPLIIIEGPPPQPPEQPRFLLDTPTHWPAFEEK